jgi:hypothetical protein
MNLNAFANSFKSLWGVALVVTTTGPLTLWIPELNPPWPIGSSILATLFSVMSVVLILGLVNNLISASKLSDVVVSKYQLILKLGGSLSIIIGLVFCIVYLFFYSSYVISERRIVNGKEETLRFIIGNEKQEWIENNYQHEIELLRDNQYDPSKIWTRDSLSYVRLLLLSSFILTFTLLTSGIALFSVQKMIRSS